MKKKFFILGLAAISLAACTPKPPIPPLTSVSTPPEPRETESESIEETAMAAEQETKERESFVGETAETAPDETKDETTEETIEESTPEKPLSNTPSGAGIVSEETLQKSYVWLTRIVLDPFDLTYDDMSQYYMKNGFLDFEGISEYSGYNKRSYKWISADDEEHFVYISFEEKDAENEPGVYKISEFGPNGFSVDEAEAKYMNSLEATAPSEEMLLQTDSEMEGQLEPEMEIQPEMQEQEMEPETVAQPKPNPKPKNVQWVYFSVDITAFGGRTPVPFEMQIPDSGWSYDENNNRLVGEGGFIQFDVQESLEDFEYFKEDYENVHGIGARTIGGYQFSGSTYENEGYFWTEYIAQINSDHAVAVAIVNLDLSEGTTASKIVDSMTF